MLDLRGKPKKVDGRRLYRIEGRSGCGMEFRLGGPRSDVVIRIPEGFVTDGPSIPSAVRWLVPRRAQEQAMKSAAVHDYLCERPDFSRPEADAQFLVAMYAEGTPAIWREIFFRAVRTNNSKQVRDENRQLDLFDDRDCGCP